MISWLLILVIFTNDDINIEHQTINVPVIELKTEQECNEFALNVLTNKESDKFISNLNDMSSSYALKCEPFSVHTYETKKGDITL